MKKSSTLRALVWRAALAAFFFSALLLSVSWSHGWEGIWVDRLASETATGFARFPVQVRDVRIQGPGEVRFGALAFGQESTLTAKGGRFRLERWEWWSKSGFSRATLALEKAVIRENFYRRLPVMTWMPVSALSGPLLAEKMSVVFSKHSGSLYVHVLHFDSPQMVLRGGVQMRKGRLVKANLMLFLPEEKLNRLPKGIRGNFLKKNGLSGVRVTYGNGQLTASGTLGPFFKATWN